MTAGNTRRRIIILCLAVLPAVTAMARNVRFADGLVYNPFYAVRVYTADGTSFTLVDAAAWPGDAPPWPSETGNVNGRPGKPSDKTMFYFFWIRRIGNTGAVTYPLSFDKISEIQLTGPFEESTDKPQIEGRLTVDEEEFDVYLHMNGARFSGWKGSRQPAVPGYTPALVTFTDGTKQKVYLKTDGFLGGIDQEFGSYAMLWLRHDGIEKLEFLNSGTYVRCPQCGTVYYDKRAKTCPFDGADLVAEK